jgi:trans-aconitate 2-methyltransferase
MTSWSPEKYLRFADERNRPASDLIGRLAQVKPRAIVDLGCGPGNSTALLREAFPQAEMTGVDSSPAMIERALMSGTSACFELADAATWPMARDVDLVFSNALFQWVTDHMQVMLRIFDDMQPGAVFAAQMPDNLQEASHTEMAVVAQNIRWRERLHLAAAARSPIGKPEAYYTLFAPLAMRVEVWRTVYYHLLDGVEGIIDMLSSTGLRPFLDPLDNGARTAFVRDYAQALHQHYPLLPNGKVLLAFPRSFIVAIRGDRSSVR